MNYLAWERKWRGIVEALDNPKLTDDEKATAILELYEPWRESPEQFAYPVETPFAGEIRRLATLAREKFGLWAVTIPDEAQQYTAMLAFSGYHARVSTKSAYKKFIFIRPGPGLKEIERGKIIENWRQGGMDYAYIINTDWMYCSQTEWHRRMGGVIPVVGKPK